MDEPFKFAGADCRCGAIDDRCHLTAQRGCS
jgi:hypothetical protein